MSVRNVELEAALLGNRDDARQWAVYGDWLEVNGSPRGAVVSLMLSREATPRTALSDAVKTNAQLIAELTPEPLKTIGTRCYPRLAPVFRRGFIQSAGALDASDFAALVEHPSCALLERVLLELSDVETLDGWLDTVRAPLPWRDVEVSVRASGDKLALKRLMELLPRLEQLTLSFATETTDLAFRPSATLARVRVVGATPEIALAIANAPLSALRSLELRLVPPDYGDYVGANRLDDTVAALERRWATLDEVVLEGEIGEATRRACEKAARPKRVVVRGLRPTADAFYVPLQRDLETSFAVMNRAFTPEHAQAITHFARLAGVQRLVLYTREVRVGPKTVTLLRVHGEGDAPLVPRVVAHQLARRDRSLDAVALTVSASNDTTSTWSFGPHVAKEDSVARNTIPTARRDEGRYTRSQVAREVLDALLGFDPGLDVLDDLAASLDLATPHTLIGAAPAPGEQVHLFTDFEAQPDYDQGLDDEYAQQDPLDHGEDEDEQQWDDEIFYEPDAWGGEPISVPDFGARDAQPPPAAAATQPAEVVGEEDEESDAPLFDAYDADAEEIWLEGPVDVPEHHRGFIGETVNWEPADMPLASFEASLVPCAHCGQLREVSRCSACREEVCRACAGAPSADAWDEEREFVCGECTPHEAPLRPRS